MGHSTLCSAPAPRECPEIEVPTELCASVARSLCPSEATLVCQMRKFKMSHILKKCAKQHLQRWGGRRRRARCRDNLPFEFATGLANLEHLHRYFNTSCKKSLSDINLMKQQIQIFQQIISCRIGEFRLLFISG